MDRLQNEEGLRTPSDYNFSVNEQSEDRSQDSQQLLEAYITNDIDTPNEQELMPRKKKAVRVRKKQKIAAAFLASTLLSPGESKRNAGIEALKEKKETNGPYIGNQDLVIED